MVPLLRSKILNVVYTSQEALKKGSNKQLLITGVVMPLIEKLSLLNKHFLNKEEINKEGMQRFRSDWTILFIVHHIQIELSFLWYTFRRPREHLNTQAPFYFDSGITDTSLLIKFDHINSHIPFLVLLIPHDPLHFTSPHSAFMGYVCLCICTQMNFIRVPWRSLVIYKSMDNSLVCECVCGVIRW